MLLLAGRGPTANIYSWWSSYFVEDTYEILLGDFSHYRSRTRFPHGHGLGLLQDSLRRLFMIIMLFSWCGFAAIHVFLFHLSNFPVDSIQSLGVSLPERPSDSEHV